MCRSIKTLRDAEPPATEAEVEAAALQLVRKVSGYRSPLKANEMVFEAEVAVAEVSASTRRLLESLVVKPGSGPREQSGVDPTRGAGGR